METVFEIELPVGEHFQIRRMRYAPVRPAEKPPRIAIVSGIHGDELEGQYVAFLLGEFLQQHKEALTGIVDIYPAINAIGIDSIERKVPPYNVDLNRVFPGSPDDVLPFRIADAVVETVKGADYALDIHSSNIFLRELPQIRISEENAEMLCPLAKHLNIDFVWVHQSVTVLQSTFSHTMNSLGTKTLVVEMGVGMRITQEYCHQLFDGIVNFLSQTGFLPESFAKEVRTPMDSRDGEVHFLNSQDAGIFIPDATHNEQVSQGDTIGRIVSALEGRVISEVKAPCDGLVFTLRRYPVVYEGSLLARIYKGNGHA